jgi:hypothetical protein
MLAFRAVVPPDSTRTDPPADVAPPIVEAPEERMTTFESAVIAVVVTVLPVDSTETVPSESKAPDPE